MKKSAQLWYLVLLIPTFIESIDHKLPTVSLGPLTIGRLGFIIVGILMLFQYPNQSKDSNIYKGLMIMLLGNIIAGIVNNEMDSVSRTIAFSLLMTGALGMTTFFATPIGRNALMVFFISSFIYWVKYMFDRIFSGGSINAYSALFIEGDAINHHFVGMNISIAGLFTSIYFFYKNNNMKIWGYFGIGIAAIACFLSESRSNTLFTLSGLLLLLVIQRKNISRQVFILLPFLIVAYLAVDNLLQESDALSQRFDINDTEYQERTTGMRFDMIYAAFNQLVQHPIGKGFRNIYVNIDGRNLNIHNQYLSFIIGGGIISLIGVIIWLRQVILGMFSYLSFGMFRLKNDSFYVAIAISTFIFHVTLLTLEFSTLLLFFIISLAILSETKIKEEQRKMRYESSLK
jgi:hypothetical protein